VFELAVFGGAEFVETALGVVVFGLMLMGKAA
jgi:hypothetical protein